MRPLFFAWFIVSCLVLLLLKSILAVGAVGACCYVSLPRGVMDLSVVCKCGISWLYTHFMYIVC